MTPKQHLRENFNSKDRFLCYNKGINSSSKTHQASLILNLEKTPLSPELFGLTIIEKIKGNDTKQGRYIKNELQKIKPDQRGIIRNAFELLNSREKSVVFENIEKIFELNNFSGIENVLELIMEMKDITIIGTTSFPTFCKKKLKGFLFKEEKHENEGEERWDKSNEHEYELFLTKALARARGQSMLSALLNIVYKKPMTLSEISRKIYRSAPVTKSLLERLIEVDLVEKRGKKFYIKSPAMEKHLEVRA